MAGIWSFKLNFVKNLCFNYYSRNLVSFNFRVDNARVFQWVSMNLNMTFDQAVCQLLCRYSQSTLAASCVCWIILIVTCDSIKRTCGCSCLKCTWSVAWLTGGRGANRPPHPPPAKLNVKTWPLPSLYFCIYYSFDFSRLLFVCVFRSVLRWFRVFV